MATAAAVGGADEPGPVELPVGKTVAKKWKIIEKLGEGGCGAVYLVEDTKNKAKAALKAESNFVAGGSVLKLEVQVLKRLAGRKYVAQLITSGKKERYCYMVMTLFGHSLGRLFKFCRREFTPSTQVRLGLQMLYGLKQLHEVGYVHRDLKPANLAIGKKGKSMRVVHLLDFGLSREYIIKIDGKTEIRKPRENTLFRGTTKYCSAHANCRGEQGRVDDLWSMVYVLAEMRGPLPWDQLRDKHEIGKKKKATSDETLLSKCPPPMLEIAKHLRDLDYYKRPDYAKIYHILDGIMVDLGVKHADQFDWELLPNYNQLTTEKKPSRAARRTKIITVSEDVSIAKTTESSGKHRKDPTVQSEESDDKPPFNPAEFEKNELGF
uniref:Protein kinase domain-containing protein n=1 Tax=Panagrolaimus sp. ES5 TaxID=591445 RepID=A0AC34F9K3_9BILA